MTAGAVVSALAALLLVVGLIIGAAVVARRWRPAMVRTALAGQPATLARLPGQRRIVGVTVEGRRYHLLLGRGEALLLSAQEAPAFDALVAAEVGR